MDLGSGSGILPIIVKQKSDFSGKVTCLDFSENSLMCQKENLKEFGFWEAQLNLKTVDIVQKWLPKEISQKKKPEQIQKYDEVAEEL